VRGGIFGFYRTMDDCWLQIHGAMPHHREGILKFLGSEETREAVAAAIERWKGQELEDALAAIRMPTGPVRSRAKWQAHPQGTAVAGLPLLHVTRIGDAPAEPFGPAARPPGACASSTSRG